MSSKVVKNIKNREEKFSMRHFSEVERGEAVYHLRSFAADEELSVQDMFSATGESEPDTIETKFDEVTENDYLPPSKLAKAADGPVGQKVEMPKARAGGGFVESDMFCDFNEKSEEFPKKVIRQESDKSDDGVFECLSPEEAGEIDSKIADLTAKLKESEEKCALLEASIAEKNTEITNLKTEIDTMKEGLPAQLETAKTEGIAQGDTDAKVKYDRQYEGDKADYLAKVDSFNASALKELTALNDAVSGADEQLGEIVIGFVNAIIGSERKLNDQFIANFIKHNLSRLNDLKDVRFAVNPADLEAVKAAFPDYVVSTDTSLLKGTARITTKIGEVVLDPASMSQDLENQIKAAFAAEKA